MDQSLRKSVILGNYDPERPFLSVDNGLNMLGHCPNKECICTKNGSGKTWVQLGYGDYELGKIVTNTKCPHCGHKMRPKKFTSIGYMRAEVSIEGEQYVKSDNVEESDEETIKVKRTDREDKGLFIKFEETRSSQVKWAYLTITAKKI